MRVCVQGLWHLGCVTAACMAAVGHDVVGLDENAVVIGELRSGRPPIFEPGLAGLLQSGLDADRLRFTTDPQQALADVDVLWVTYDTPVDENDVGDVGYVVGRVEGILRLIPQGALVLVSSQVPVGSTRELARRAANMRRAKEITFGYSPENLRLGKAIDVFMRPDRIVVGLEDSSDRTRITALLAPMQAPILYMSIESAEMTKHAINTFLAMSVAFANEIASVCEAVGADARDVARGLKTEPRIGDRAYVSPGVAFGGGTLARDIEFLSRVARTRSLALELIPSIRVANDAHKEWAIHKLRTTLGSLEGKRIAILGLTYKPGTDTLRRSPSMEIARRLRAEGAQVVAHDPIVRTIPDDGQFDLIMVDTVEEALRGVDAAVIATEWPKLKQVDWPRALSGMKRAVIIDPSGMIEQDICDSGLALYARVGYTAASAA